MRSAELNVAIIGALGRQGRRRLDAVRKLEGLSARWLVGRPGTHAAVERLAESCGARASTAWVDAVDDPLTHVVVVCTPNAAHAECAVRALRNGKHVLVEKPLAGTLGEAEQIVREARASSSLLKTGFNYPFHDLLRAGLEHLRRGTIGDLTVVRITVGHGQFAPGRPSSWFRDPTRVGRGAMLDVGIHAIDLARRAIDVYADDFERVVALTRHRPSVDCPTPSDLEDDATAIYRTRSGKLFTLHASWLDRRSTPGLELTLLGTEGHLAASLATNELRVSRVVVGETIEEVSTFRSDEMPRSWTAELAAFRDAIVDGSALDGDGEDGLTAQRLAECAYESATNGGLPVMIGESTMRERERAHVDVS